jgi:hypothetical protein
LKISKKYIEKHVPELLNYLSKYLGKQSLRSGSLSKKDRGQDKEFGGFERQAVVSIAPFQPFLAAQSF